MEYGYEMTDTVGNKTFFVEGCTYCSMTTGGLHEQHCPLNKDSKIYQLTEQGLEDINKGRVRILKYNDDGTFIKEIG